MTQQVYVLLSGSRCVPLNIREIGDVYNVQNGSFFLLDKSGNIKAWFEVPTSQAERLYTMSEGHLFRELLILNKRARPLVRMVGHNGKIFQYYFEG